MKKKVIDSLNTDLDIKSWCILRFDASTHQGGTRILEADPTPTQLDSSSA